MISTWPLCRGSPSQAQAESNVYLVCIDSVRHVVDRTQLESEILVDENPNFPGDQQPALAALLSESEAGPR